MEIELNLPLKMDLGVECSPKPTQTKDLQKLCTLDFSPDQEGEWVVWTFVCNEDVSEDDDGLYGLLIFLGHYPKKALAKARAREIALQVDVRVCISSLGRWVELNSKPQIKNSEIVCVDVEGNIVKLEDQKFEREKKLYKEQKDKQLKRIREQSSEDDPSHPSYYRKEWLKTIRAHQRMKALREEINNLQKIYERSCFNLFEHHSKYPEHDKEWLDRLKELDYSEDTLSNIEENYHFLKDKILQK